MALSTRKCQEQVGETLLALLDRDPALESNSPKLRGRIQSRVGWWLSLPVRRFNKRDVEKHREPWLPAMAKLWNRAENSGESQFCLMDDQPLRILKVKTTQVHLRNCFTILTI